MDSAQNQVNNQKQTEELMQRSAVADEIQSDRLVKRLGKDTYVPIGIIVVVIVVGIYIGSLATRVQALVDKDSPSRSEYDQLSDRLNSIDKNLTSLNDYLREKK